MKLILSCFATLSLLASPSLGGSKSEDCIKNFTQKSDLYLKYGLKNPDEKDYDLVLKESVILMPATKCFWCDPSDKKEEIHPFLSSEFQSTCDPQGRSEKCPDVPELVPVFGGLVGVGTYGFVYTACNSEIRSCLSQQTCCPYAVKIQISSELDDKEWDFNSDVPQNKFMTEVRYQTIASSYKLAPRVYNAWTCELATAHSRFKKQPHDFFVMQKYSETLLDYQVENKLNDKMEDEIIDKIQSLHNDAGIFHGDLHTKNIMVQESESEKNTRWAIIDFGKSKTMEVSDKVKKLSQAIHDYHNLYITSSKRALFFKAKIWHIVKNLAGSNVFLNPSAGNIVLGTTSFDFTFPNVVIQNTSRADLNGKSGKLTDYDPKTSRYIVMIDKKPLSFARDKIARAID